MDTQTDIEARAVDWLIRHDAGPLSDAERAEFDAWLCASTRHHVAYVRAQAAWRRANSLKRLRPIDGSIDENLLEPSTRRWRWGPVSVPWAVTTAVASAAGLVVAAWLALHSLGWEAYSTEVGSTERIILRDGSTIDLNTDSQLRVRLTPGRRDVVLTRGEALFQVAEDPSRPFEVYAGRTRVRAVGTAFAVRLHGQRDVEVLVTEGLVAIDPPDFKAMIDMPVLPPSVPTLSAGEAARVLPTGLRVSRVQPEDISRKLAWKEGRLWFDDTTLEEAVGEFNRYNRQRLTIADPEIADLRIGGGFDATDPNSFVVALEKSFGIRAVPDPRSSDAEVISLVRADPQ